jgi:hypothetical protein
MPRPAIRSLRDRLPAVLLTILFHVAVIAVLLNAIPKRAARMAREPETIIPLAPLEKSRPPAKPRTSRGNAAISPHNSPIIPPSFREQPNLEGLNLALSSCAPEKLGLLAPEVREKCERIETALFAGQDALPNALRIKSRTRWQTDLQIKQTPLLLPCASPYGCIDVLYTLSCLGDLIENGYHPENVAHYSK